MKGREIVRRKGKQKERENLVRITMRKMLLLIIWLSSVRCQPSKIHVSAQEGGLAEISCPYDSGYETYPKYFYKGIYGKRQSIIETAAGKKGSAQRGKYYIYDDTKRRMLHVTIHNINLNDAETYWCWIDAYGFDPKTEIELKVYKAPAPPLVTSHPPATTVSDSASATLWSTTPEDIRTVLPPVIGKRLYLAVAAAVAVAVLLLCLMVLYFKLRKHRHDTGSTFGGEAAPWISTWSTVVYVKNQNICSIRSPYTEAGDPHISEDGHLPFSTICFNATNQPTPSHSQVFKHKHLSHVHKGTFPSD